MFSIFNKNQIITETLRDYIDRKLSQFGSPEYAYTVVNKKNPSKLLIISSYPDEWVNLYIANNLQHIDPVILTAFKRTSPFVWDENITLMSDLKVSKIFSLSKKYNIANGYTFVLHDHLNNLALLSLIIDSNRKRIWKSSSLQRKATYRCYSLRLMSKCIGSCSQFRKIRMVQRWA